MTLGFTESKADSNLCFKVEDGRSAMLLLCVDALLILVMEVWQSTDGIFLGQGKYAVEIWDDGLQGINRTYGIKPKAIE